MNAALEWHREIGVPKFEYFVTLKWMLSDTDALLRVIGPLALSRWRLYHAPEDTFPLTDSPILVRPKSILVALSPRLLLEIDPTRPTTEDDWEVPTEMISDTRLLEFRRRTIGNTFREIIFSNRETLEAWRETSDFRKRVALMRDMKSYNARVRVEKGRELWLLNAHGNKS